MLTLSEILEALTGAPHQQASLAFSEAAIDSREVKPSAMFVALPGERTDGHAYVGEAFKNGAKVALVQQDLSAQFQTLDLRSGTLPEGSALPETPFCLRIEDSLKAMQQIAAFKRKQMPNLRVIGITGSVGKSTTKELVAEVMCQRYNTLKSPGNLNNEIGLPLTLLQLRHDHECAVMEMGFYIPGEIAFLCDIAQPQVGVITNIGTVHAERAGSQAEIARGKAELVAFLPQDGTAILNYDDALVRPMADMTRASVFFYGLTPEADVWADNIIGRGLEGVSFVLHYRNEALHLRIPLIGRHSVHTALRAAAVGLVEGLSWDEIITGLLKGKSQLRMAVVQTPSGALILDDTYNASPESTLAALNLLSEIPGNHIAVLGDMLELGPYERQGHSMVGTRTAEVCEELVAVGLRGKIIAEAAQQTGMPAEKIFWVETVPEAIEYLRQREFSKNDIILVKGSHGLHMERIVAALEEIER